MVETFKLILEGFLAFRSLVSEIWKNFSPFQGVFYQKKASQTKLYFFFFLVKNKDEVLFRVRLRPTPKCKPLQFPGLSPSGSTSQVQTQRGFHSEGKGAAHSAKAWLPLGLGTPYLYPEHLTWQLLESTSSPCFECLFSACLNILHNIIPSVPEKASAKLNAFKTTLPFIICSGTSVW